MSALWAVVAYVPFIDPLDAHHWWYLLLVPMAALIAVSYKAVRVETLRDFPKEAAIMTVQIVLGIVLIGVASFLFVEEVLPMIAR